jgi:hypothetical protein
VKKFPHLVQLHQQHAEKGLVCVSLNVEMGEIKEKDKVEAFLKKQGAAFANFIFKDDRKVVSDWQDKHDANATPNYLVWDRAGKPVKLPYPQKEAAIDKILADLLAEK